jgi:hypothetical protein
MSVYRPAPYSGHGADLPRYVLDELQRIAAALERLQGAATLYLESAPAAARALTSAWALLDDFDSQTPARSPVGVQPDAPDGALYIRDPGLWAVSFAVTALGLAADSSYEARVFVDGSPSALYAVVTTANKAIEASFAAIGTFRAAGPMALDLRVREGSGSGGSWQTAAAYFSAFRVGA